MKKMYRFLTLFALLSLLFLPTGAVHAQGSDSGGDGRVIFGSNFTLESGESFNGDLVVFGGNVTVEEDANLNGNLVIFGGTVDSNGKVIGDVVIIGGQVELDEKAHVTGDVVTVGGQLQQAEGAQVDGEIVNNVQPDIEFPNGLIPPTINVPDVPTPVVNVGFNPFWEFGKALGWSIFVALLGALATLFFQDRLGRVSQAVVAQPLMVGGIGLLSVFVAVAMFFTIIPLFALAFAWLFGVIAIGQEIGERFAKSVRQDWTPVITTGVGTFALVFLVSSIQTVGDVAWFVGCVTWIIPALIGLLAIGAVVLTRVGARPIQSPAMTTNTPPTDTGQVPPAS